EASGGERPDDRTEIGELLGEQVRHRLALDLVRVEQLVTLHRPGVPCDRDTLRPVVDEQLEQHVGEAEQGVRREALARGELLRQPQASSGREVVAVDEKQRGVADRRVVERKFFARQGFWPHTSKAIVLPPCPGSKSSRLKTSTWTPPPRCWPSAMRVTVWRSRCCPRSPTSADSSNAISVTSWQAGWQPSAATTSLHTCSAASRWIQCSETGVRSSTSRAAERGPAGAS